MKNLAAPEIAKYRDIEADRLRGVDDESRQWGGAFLIPHYSDLKRVSLRVIASRGDPAAPDDIDRWDHVSVSLRNRCPTWAEMEFVKRLFFKPEEAAFQLHVPPAAHISNHAFCLHMWRPVDRDIPLPPVEAVGLPGLVDIQ